MAVVTYLLVLVAGIVAATLGLLIVALVAGALCGLLAFRWEIRALRRALLKRTPSVETATPAPQTEQV